MKMMITLLMMTLSTNLLAASTVVHKSAEKVSFKDMKLVKVVDTKTPYETFCKKRGERSTPCTEYNYTYKNAVKVSLGYSALKEICRSKRGQEVCYTRMIPQITSVNLDALDFSEETIQILKARKIFSSKKKYIALAKSVLNLEVEKTRAGVLINVTNK